MSITLDTVLKTLVRDDATELAIDIGEDGFSFHCTVFNRTGREPQGGDWGERLAEFVTSDYDDGILVPLHTAGWRGLNLLPYSLPDGDGVLLTATRTLNND